MKSIDEAGGREHLGEVIPIAQKLPSDESELSLHEVYAFSQMFRTGANIVKRTVRVVRHPVKSLKEAGVSLDAKLSGIAGDTEGFYGRHPEKLRELDNVHQLPQKRAAASEHPAMWDAAIGYPSETSPDV